MNIDAPHSPPAATSAQRPVESSVILLGTDTPIGLALIRELGEEGVKVIGLGRSHRSIGAKSRHIAHYYVRQKTGEALVEQLNHLANTHQCAHLMAISEADIVWLNQQRKHLAVLQLLIPNQQQMDQVLNKSATYSAAEQLGINTPKSYQISRLEDLDRYRSELVFPLILKWDNPQETIAKLRPHRLPLIKTQFIDDFEGLTRALQPYQVVGEYPLIQHYVKGRGLGQFFLIHNGEVIQRFQHERLHEWPPEGGTSTLCRGVSLRQHTSLLQQSEALLKSLRWEGVAMVEYRHDPDSGDSYLMEINGRFWGSYPLAQQSGAKFGWLWLAIAGFHRQPSVEAPQTHLTCRFIFPELRRLFRVIVASKKISDPYYINTPVKDVLRFLSLYLSPATRYYVFQWADRRPFFQDLKNALRKIRKAASEKIHSSGKVST